MLDQILALVTQYGQSTIVNSTDVPNQHNEAALGLTTKTIVDGLKGAASQGALPQLLSMASNAQEITNSPIIKTIVQTLAKEFTSQLSLSPDKAGDVAANTVQQVISGFLSQLGKSGPGATDLAALAQSVLGGGQLGGGLASALDKNHDGKVDLNDAVAGLAGEGALGAIAGKLLTGVLK